MWGTSSLQPAMSADDPAAGIITLASSSSGSSSLLLPVSTAAEVTYTAAMAPDTNRSVNEGCLEVVFDTAAAGTGTLAGAELEAVSRHVKDFLLAFLYLIGGPANVISMAVFFKQGLKDRVNLCLFSLSLADGLYLTMALFLHGEQLLRLLFTTTSDNANDNASSQFGPVATFMINHHLTVLGGFCYVSPVLSAVIATERCLCVVSPLRFHALLRTRTMAGLIVAVNVLTLGTQSVVAFRYHVGCVRDPVTGRVMRGTMVDGDFYRAHRELVNKLDAFVFGSGLPLTVIAVVSVATVVTAVKLRRIVRWRCGSTARPGAVSAVARASSSSSSSSISAKEMALTRMLIANSLLFMACILPTAAIRFVWLFLSDITSAQQNQNFFLISLWAAEAFTYVNASLNIFVYYSMGSRYRETFWALFGRKAKEGRSKASLADCPTQPTPP